VAAPDLSSIWRQEWRTTGMIGLNEDKVVEWEGFVAKLRNSHVRIKDEEDVWLWSKSPALGIYTSKVGYRALCEDQGSGEAGWWWKIVCKFQCPLKTCIFMWLALSNKVLIWDIWQKRSWQGPNRCSLCKENEETIEHLLMSCGYTIQAWKKVEALIGLKDVWRGPTIEESLQQWSGNLAVKRYKALPLIITCRGWLARNSSLFDDQAIPAVQCATQGMSILISYKQVKNDKSQRQVIEEKIDRTGAWEYFHGAAQGDPKVCEAGGVIFWKDSHTLKFKAGGGTNNMPELMAPKLILMLAAEKGASRIQIFADSPVINWMKGLNDMGNFLLRPIYDEIQNFKTSFNTISFHHVYRERNEKAE
jgi:ribonuclease HI